MKRSRISWFLGPKDPAREALKLASNARCFANRAVASLYLGNFEQCLEDPKPSPKGLAEQLLAGDVKAFQGISRLFKAQ